MYHRFNESKYPSTNIQMNIFKKHINIIRSAGYDFLNPEIFSEVFSQEKISKQLGDGYLLSQLE